MNPAAPHPPPCSQVVRGLFEKLVPPLAAAEPPKETPPEGDGDDGEAGVATEEDERKKEKEAKEKQVAEGEGRRARVDPPSS